MVSILNTALAHSSGKTISLKKKNDKTAVTVETATVKNKDQQYCDTLQLSNVSWTCS